jgi:hypothetical protein
MRAERKGRPSGRPLLFSADNEEKISSLRARAIFANSELSLEPA